MSRDTDEDTIVRLNQGCSEITNVNLIKTTSITNKGIRDLAVEVRNESHSLVYQRHYSSFSCDVCQLLNLVPRYL